MKPVHGWCKTRKIEIEEGEKIAFVEKSVCHHRENKCRERVFCHAHFHFQLMLLHGPRVTELLLQGGWRAAALQVYVICERSNERARQDSSKISLMVDCCLS